MDSKIEWLHISDLHFGYNDNTVKQMRDLMPDYIENYFENRRVEYIFVTGDIIHGKSNHSESYKEAAEYIKNIAQRLKVKPDKIFIVPGNHDYNRNESSRSLYIDDIRRDYVADVGQVNRKHLKSMENDYIEFKVFYKEVCGREYDTNHFLIQDKIDILHLNSALTSYGSIQDKNNLILGMELVDEALEKHNIKKPMFVLSHHSFEWFTDGERNKLELHLKRKNAVLFLCGHIHQSKYNLVASLNQKQHLHECMCATNMDLDEKKQPSEMGFFVGEYDIQKNYGQVIECIWDKKYEKFKTATIWPFSSEPMNYLNFKNENTLNTTDIEEHTVKKDNELNIPIYMQLGEPFLTTEFGKYAKKKSSIECSKDTVFLITGGAGFVGSELCRQICERGFTKIVIVDIYGEGLYELKNEVYYKYGVDIETELVSVCDYEGMENVFLKHAPDMVFHCGFQKHNMLMEKNKREAIINNILGTHNLLILSQKSNIKKFIYVSTDKAVFPTSIMGITKRIGELLTSYYDRINANIKFYSIRFGNLIGSSGNLVHLIEKQISKGEPVKLTHPEITRFFMTGSEAVELILDTEYIANGGETFILDMGQPIKLADLVKDIVRQKGLRINKDVKIEYTGLRPGEKLFEELLINDEGVLRTDNERIYASPVIQDKKLIQFCELYNNFLGALKQRNYEGVLETIKEIIENRI